jgi:hypothetical protein
MTHKVRYLLIMLIFVVSAVVYIDRSNISIAGTYLARTITSPSLALVSRPFAGLCRLSDSGRLGGGQAGSRKT